MPELPETETLARDLDAVLRGQTIAGAETVHADVLRGTTGAALERRVAGRSVTGVWRRAKAVVVDLSDGQRLVVVPRFTGGLLVRPPGTPRDAYDAIRFTLDGGDLLAYRDVRRLGTVALMDRRAFAAFDARLGIEPLSSHFTPATLSAFIRSSRQSIKKLLMDQHRLAGVGNIYANESLWGAHVDPSRAGGTLSSAEVVALRGALVDVLTRAVGARGTTFRDFRDAHGAAGRFAAQLAVYGREGQPCRRCATRLALTHAIDGRATVFCFRCQR